MLKSFKENANSVSQALNHVCRAALTICSLGLPLLLTLSIWLAYGWRIGIAVGVALTFVFVVVSAGVRRIDRKLREVQVKQRHFSGRN